MTNRRLAALLTLLAGLVAGAALTLGRPEGRPPSPPPAPSAPLTDAFRAHRSHVEVETGGRVQRLLGDDREGSRHERFILRVEGGLSVLVAHNIDLAPRVPVAAGDSVALRGEYDWNERGGVIHWTHRDPAGRHEAGWIWHDGRTYR